MEAVWDGAGKANVWEDLGHSLTYKSATVILWDISPTHRVSLDFKCVI